MLGLLNLGFPREYSPAESGGDGVVDLHQNNGGDAVVGVEKTERGAGGVERLRDYNAADDGGMNFCRDVVGEKMGAGGIGPAPVEHHAEKQDVEPVDQQGDAVVDELGEQRSRERRERDGAEEGNVNPREVAVGAGELVELGLLAHPEDAIEHDAHQKYDETRREHDEGMPEVVLGMNGFAGGDAEVEHQQGHGYGEDAVAEGGETLDTFSCNAVVERVHQKESIGLPESGQKPAG
jgi:hypothetical protein